MTDSNPYTPPAVFPESDSFLVRLKYNIAVFLLVITALIAPSAEDVLGIIITLQERFIHHRHIDDLLRNPVDE